MLVSNLLSQFTRRRFLQTSATTCALPSLPGGSAVTQAFTALPVEKSIEQLGLAIFNYDRGRDAERLLANISSRAICGACVARDLTRGGISQDSSSLRRCLFMTGNDIALFLSRRGDDTLHFLETIPPEDILRAKNFFHLQNDYVSWDGECFAYKNPKMNENANQFAHNPEVRRYIEAGNYLPNQLGIVSTTELAKMLFDDLRCQVSLLYSFHTSIAQFLYLIEHRRDIGVKNGRAILKFFGERYAPFKDIVIQRLNSEFEFDVQKRMKGEEEAKARLRQKQDSSSELNRQNYVLTPNDRQTLAGLCRTAVDRFLRADVDGQTIGDLCFDFDFKPQYRLFSYATAAQLALEAGITNGYENYEYDL